MEVKSYTNLLDYFKCNPLKAKDGFRIVYLNARSIKNKMDEIDILNTKLQIDILVITETWIHRRDTLFYNFNDFQSIYSCRNREGGWCRHIY